MSETPKPTPSRTHERTSQRGRGKRLTHEERDLAQKTFLRQFAYLGNMMASCRTANIDRKTIYEWLEKDETFSLKYHIAEAESADVIRAEIFRRAIQGVEEPVVSQGKVVRDDQGKPLMVRKYSDQLLTTLAKSRMPEYRDRADPVVANGADLPGLTIIIPHLPESERARYIHQGPPPRIVEAPDVSNTPRSDPD